MSEQAPTPEGVRRHAGRFGFPFPPLAGGSEQPGPDTPAVAGPEEAPGSAQDPPEIPWQKRYEDLQPEYTRATQKAAELEQRQQYYELALTSEDEDTRRQAIEALGYELPDPEEPEPVEYEDPYDSLAERQQRLEQRYEQDRRAEQEAHEGRLINELATERLKALGLSEKEDQDLVLAYAINALPPVQQPPGSPVRILPDVEQAFEFFQARETERQKQWAKTKRAPYVPPGGLTANEVPDTSTHQGRVDKMMRRLSEMEQQT